MGMTTKLTKKKIKKSSAANLRTVQLFIFCITFHSDFDVKQEDFDRQLHLLYEIILTMRASFVQKITKIE